MHITFAVGTGKDLIKAPTFVRCCNAPLLNLKSHKCITCGKAYLA